MRGGALRAALQASLRDEARSGGAPLLVLRLPEFAEFAWRDGRPAARRLERSTTRAVADAARRVMRDGDVTAHDPGSDWFAIAMLAPARGGTFVQALDARSALERIAAAVSLATGRRMQTGWLQLTERTPLDDLDALLARALERGSRERERYEFLAAVGHELRTPLTSIRGYLETLLDEETDAATARRFLEVARREALRLGRLVDGMLDFSLLDLAPHDERGPHCELAEVVRAVLDALAPIAREAGIALRAANAGGFVARIDPDACMHALINLVENAVKYGRRGGHVAVSLERVDPFIDVIVDDDGPGVPVAEWERVFEHRARGSTVGERSGRGIGLALVRTIAERVTGTVAVAVSPLGGARFVLRLPSARAESAAHSS